MADSAVITANARIRAISNSLFQLGTGLIAAAVVKWYAAAVAKAAPFPAATAAPTSGIELVGWLFTAIVLISVGAKVLILLESES